MARSPALAVAFVLVGRRAAAPVLPPRLFTGRTFTVSVLLSVVSGFAFLGSVNYVAVYLQSAAGADPVRAGLHLLPMTLAVAAAPVVTSRIVTRTGAYPWASRLSTALGLLAAAGLSTLDEHRPAVLVFGCLVLSAWPPG